MSTPLILIKVAKITGLQCVRGRGGTIAVLYETHWKGILRHTWERELDIQSFCSNLLAYWASGLDHRQRNKRHYQQLRIDAAALEIPVLKAKVTSWDRTASYPAMSNVPAFPRPLCLPGPPSGITPLTALGPWTLRYTVSR